MGANLDYRVFQTDDRAKIRSDWEEIVECDLYDKGHSYSGSVGMLGADIKWHPVPSKTASEAVDVLCEKHGKWDGPLAVRFDGGWVVGGWCSS